MTEIQSIIGINELKRLDHWNLARRYQYAAMYDAAFSGLPGIKKLPLNTKERKNAYWWYPIILDLDVLTIKADKFIKELAALNIPCYGIQWPEAYEERAYKELNGFGATKFPFLSKEYTSTESVEYTKVICPVAKDLRNCTFNLFLHPTWEKEHIVACIMSVETVINANMK